MKRTILAAVPLLALGCASHPREFEVTPVSGPPQAATVSLAGIWDYNPQASDQPGRGGFSGGYGRGFGGGGRGGFGGGRGGFGGGREGGERGGGGVEGGRYGGRDSAATRIPGRLVIAQTDSTLSVDPRFGSPYTLFFDGRDVLVTDTAGGMNRTFHLNARWNKKRLDVTRELAGGRIMKESYELADHGNRLYVHVSFAGGPSDEPVMPELRRVYDKEQ